MEPLGVNGGSCSSEPTLSPLVPFGDRERKGSSALEIPLSVESARTRLIIPGERIGAFTLLRVEVGLCATKDPPFGNVVLVGFPENGDAK